MKTPRSARCNDARRQRHRAARFKAGIAMWGIPVRAHRLTGYLIATQRLPEARSTNRRSCRAAVAKLLDDLAKLDGDPRAVARMIETLQRHLRVLTRDF